MSNAYAFTADEKRVILAAYERYMGVLHVIASLHGLAGNIAIAPDFSGFLEDRPPITQMPQLEAKRK